MALGKYDSRAATVICPLSGCSVRIFKDRASYAAHMVNVHSATDTVFADEGIRGIGRVDRSAAGDGATAPKIFREEEPEDWCGCGSTTSTQDAMVAHIDADHGYTP